MRQRLAGVVSMWSLRARKRHCRKPDNSEPSTAISCLSYTVTVTPVGALSSLS